MGTAAVPIFRWAAGGGRQQCGAEHVERQEPTALNKWFITADSARPFSVAYAATNICAGAAMLSPIFSVAYAATNRYTRRYTRFARFSVAYAATNRRCPTG